MWENVLEDPSTDEIDPGLFMIPFSKISNQLLLFSVFLFSVSRFILFRRIAISDVASLLTIRKSGFFFMQNSRTRVLYLLWKQKQQQNRPNIVRYAEHDIICITTTCSSIGTTISLHGFQNLWKKCAIFLFNKPSHLIENWW